eukprot:scaffold40407_cov17-Tisochrysis_lutea.AAC.1
MDQGGCWPPVQLLMCDCLLCMTVVDPAGAVAYTSKGTTEPSQHTRSYQRSMGGSKTVTFLITAQLRSWKGKDRVTKLYLPTRAALLSKEVPVTKPSQPRKGKGYIPVPACVGSLADAKAVPVTKPA